MRKKVSVEQIRRDKSDIKDNQEIPQSAPQSAIDEKETPEISEPPLNGNHTAEEDEKGDNQDDSFEDDDDNDKDSSLDHDDPPQQQLP